MEGRTKEDMVRDEGEDRRDTGVHDLRLYSPDLISVAIVRASCASNRAVCTAGRRAAVFFTASATGVLGRTGLGNAASVCVRGRGRTRTHKPSHTRTQHTRAHTRRVQAHRSVAWASGTARMT